MSCVYGIMDHDGEVIFSIYKIYGGILAAVFVVVYPLAMFLILAKSPPPMKVYRIFLIIMTTSDFIFELMYGVMLLPVPTFPAVGGVSLGVAGCFNQTAVLVSFLMLMCCSISTIYAQCYSLMYRFTAFNSGRKFSVWFQHTKFHVIFISYLAVATSIIISGLALLHLDEETFREQATKIAVFKIEKYYPLFGFKLDSVFIYYWMAFVLANLMLAIGGSYVFLFFIFRILGNRDVHLSQKTIRVQNNFARASFIQLMLPVIFFYLPGFYSGSQFMLGEHSFSSAFSATVVSFFLASYPLLNTLVTLFYIQSYRRHVIYYIKKLFFCVPQWKESRVFSSNIVNGKTNGTTLWKPSGVYIGTSEVRRASHQ